MPGSDCLCLRVICIEVMKGLAPHTHILIICGLLIPLHVPYSQRDQPEKWLSARVEGEL